MGISPTSPERPIPHAPPPASGGNDALPPGMATSPFAKMFAQTGALPTAKELKAIIDGILKAELQAIKKSEDSWKASMKKIKEAIEEE